MSPEDENPLRRILQVHTVSSSLTIFAIHLTSYPPILISTNTHSLECSQVHTHTHTHTERSTLTQPHCVTLNGGLSPVSRSPEVKHLCHPLTRGTLTEIPCAVSAYSSKQSYICFIVTDTLHKTPPELLESALFLKCTFTPSKNNKGLFITTATAKLLVL